MMQKSETNRKRVAYYLLLEAQKNVGKVWGEALRGNVVGKREKNKIFKCYSAIDTLIETYHAWGDSDD